MRVMTSSTWKEEENWLGKCDFAKNIIQTQRLWNLVLVTITQPLHYGLYFCLFIQAQLLYFWMILKNSWNVQFTPPFRWVCPLESVMMVRMFSVLSPSFNPLPPPSLSVSDLYFLLPPQKSNTFIPQQQQLSQEATNCQSLFAFHSI